jgi:hypothetical protein
MGTSLFNTTPAATYPALLKVGDNTSLSATLKILSDGAGNDSVLALSTVSLQIGGTTGATWDNANKSLGIGTTTPLGILHLKSTAATTRMVMDGDSGQSKIITYRTAGLQRFGLYVNNTAESGSNVGSDFAVRAYSDAGTLITTALFIKRSTGNVGINTLTGTAKLQVKGSGSTSATTSLLVQNSAAATSLEVKDDGTAQIYNTLRLVGTVGYTSNLLELRMNGGAITGGSIDAFGRWNISNGGTNTTAAFIGTNVLQLGQNVDSAAIGFSDGLNVIGQWSGTAGTFNNTTNAEMIIKVNNTNSSNLYGITIAGDQEAGQLASKNLLTLSHWGSSGVQTFGTTSAVQSYTLINANIVVTPTQPNKTLRGFYYNPAISGTALAANIAFQSTSGTVHVNTATPNATAVLQADSTTQGFLPPRMTNVERAAITSPAIGLMVYCTDAVEGLYVYKSTGWTFVI